MKASDLVLLFKCIHREGVLPFRIQYHRFEGGSPLHRLIQTMPHVAFKVDSLEDAIKDEEVLLRPYEPFNKFKVAIVKRPGILLEFIETTLEEDEIWNESKYRGSKIYPEVVS